jgi:hypothetical protein
MKVSQMTGPLLCATLLSLLVLQCRKKDTEAAPVKKPPVASIKIDSPAAGAQYMQGDSILISGTAISTDLMHGCDIAIRRASDTVNNLYFIHLHAHDDTVLFQWKWKADVPAPADLEAEVTMLLDHDGLRKSGKAAFSIR